jgi:hypothetical protein
MVHVAALSINMLRLPGLGGFGGEKFAASTNPAHVIFARHL